LLALEDLHKRDVIFRDLKPDNIVMDAEGHVLLTDFGLSKEGILEPSTGARSFCGSVAYLAPEMLKRYQCVCHVDVAMARLWIGTSLA
jgi:serine/threonine protein kinase